MNGIEDNSQWREAEAQLAHGAVGRTIKLTIGTHDLYATVGMGNGRPILVDITLGRSAAHSPHHDNPVANELATQAVNDARAMLEVVCRQATALLQANVWTLDDLITAWRGTQFEPSGVCNQVEGCASSPLDAVARYLERACRP